MKLKADTACVVTDLQHYCTDVAETSFYRFPSCPLFSFNFVFFVLLFLSRQTNTLAVRVSYTVISRFDVVVHMLTGEMTSFFIIYYLLHI